MENANIEYCTIEGFPDPLTLKSMLQLYDQLFDDAKLPFFVKRLEDHIDSISILAYSNETLIAFKVGYPYNVSTFYSWVGGVQIAYRHQGIATKLASIQEKEAKQKGFIKLRTKSMNRFKPMMALNLKNGFDITQVYTNTQGQTKIIFEKPIT